MQFIGQKDQASSNVGQTMPAQGSQQQSFISQLERNYQKSVQQRALMNQNYKAM